MFSGYATKEGTYKYFHYFFKNFPDLKKETFYSEIKGLDFFPSRLGFGSYRIHYLVKEHKEALREAILSGINVIDTASNYGDGGSEILIGNVLKELFESKRIQRNQVIIITKGGYIQGKNLKLYLEKKFPDTIEISNEVYHSIHPEFLETQIEISRKRLNLETIDVYLLHNPEYFLKYNNDKKEYIKKIQKALEFLEKKRQENIIRYYGISSNTFILPIEHKENTNLVEILKIAPPGFKVIQFPANLLEIGYKENFFKNYSLIDLVHKNHLWSLSNRPFNAIYNNKLFRFSSLNSELKLGEDNPESIMMKIENQLKVMEDIFLKELSSDHFKFDEKYPSPYETLVYYKNHLQDIESVYSFLTSTILPFQKTVSFIKFKLEEKFQGKNEETQIMEIYYEYIKILNYALTFLPNYFLYKNSLKMKEIEKKLSDTDPYLKNLPLNLQIIFLLLNDRIHTVLAGMRKPIYVRQLQKIFSLEIPEKKIVAKDLIQII